MSNGFLIYVVPTGQMGVVKIFATNILFLTEHFKMMFF